MPQLLIHSEAGDNSSLTLAAETVTIGRRNTNSLCLPHLSVSGFHAQIIQEGDCPVIEDLNSTNGTMVNGKSITTHVLAHLDEIIIGSYRISYSETFTRPFNKSSENVTALSSMVPIIDPTLASQSEERAIIKVNTGSKAGSVVVLEKPVTTVGQSGGDLGAISKKSTGYYFLPVNDRGAPIKHNGRGLMPQVEVKLVGGDLLEIGGDQLEFVHPM